jgi:hypothetical protein
VAECVDLADFCEGRSDELSIASPPRPFLLRTPFVKEVVSVFRHVTSMEAVYRLAVMVLVCGKWIGWMVAWLLGSPSLWLVPGAWCLVPGAWWGSVARLVAATNTQRENLFLPVTSVICPTASRNNYCDSRIRQFPGSFWSVGIRNDSQTHTAPN